MKPDKVDAGVIRTLAEVAGIEIPDEDIEPLIGARKNTATRPSDTSARQVQMKTGSR